MNKRLLNIFLGFVLACCTLVPAFGQKFLALERYGKVKNIRIPIGTVLTYQLRDGQGWYTAEVVDLNYKDTLVIFPKIAIPLREISALRYDKNWSKGIGKSLSLFGLSWSAIALVGTLTDKNPETNYELSDAIVTGSACLTGFLLPQIFKYKIVELGKRKRLRIMDTRPSER
ncbi:MAG TPA: hypothetical protein PLE32_08500 [Haliscomenobacter sp.]|nr:hypothetical protein [Haliscomenobacter sp.]